MQDSDCVRLLQQVLPKLQMRWQGFRRVRKQVCKRIQRRINSLGLSDVDAYREHLRCHTEEWPILDHACRVTVSRFYRDRVVMDHVRTEVFPALVRSTTDAGSSLLRGWSAGCAMGEEAYSLVLLWDKTTGRDYPHLDIKLIGSDIDEVLLQRARRGCYTYGSLKALPDEWLHTAFTHHDNEYCLEPRLRNKASFIRQDIRDQSIRGPFDIVFCRNMAFTYFDQALQLEILGHIHDELVNGGALVIGGHESLPEGISGFEQWSGHRAIFRKTVNR